jgi:hypothetical protein
VAQLRWPARIPQLLAVAVRSWYAAVLLVMAIQALCLWSREAAVPAAVGPSSLALALEEVVVVAWRRCVLATAQRPLAPGARQSLPLAPGLVAVVSSSLVAMVPPILAAG